LNLNQAARLGVVACNFGIGLGQELGFLGVISGFFAGKTRIALPCIRSILVSDSIPAETVLN
jgi:hypothetical protein